MRLANFPRSSANRAFSLVEMLITITIIAVIAGIAIPAMTNVFQRSQDTAARRNAQAIAGVASSAAAAGSRAVEEAADKEAAVALLTSGVTGEGQFAGNLFVVHLKDAEREQSLKYLEFKDGRLAFDPDKE